MLSKELEMQSMTIAKFIAPKDTKNLVLNAMSLITLEDGFAIKYNTSIAPYIDYLESGTKYYKGAQGFIGTKTVDKITGLISSIQNNQFDQGSFTTEYEEVQSYKPNQKTNIRMLQSIGGVSLVSE